MEDIEEIYRQYFDEVFRYLLALSADEHLSEELTQETFFRAFRSIDSFRGDSGIKTWLFSIAKNLYYTHVRKQNKLISADEKMPLCDESHFVALLEDKELALRIYRHLHDLSDIHKEIFMLRVLGELPFEDIGRLFGKNAHWACVTYHRAKAIIQYRLREEEEE